MIKLGSNNIGKIYLGSNPIGKAYYGSDLVFQKGSKNHVGTKRAYIRALGGAFINTGIQPDATIRIIVWARNFNYAYHSGQHLFGAYYSNSRQLNFGFMNSSGECPIRVLQGSSSSSSNYKRIYGAYEYLSGYHKYELDKGSIKIDDTQVETISSPSTSTITSDLCLLKDGAGTNNVNTLPTDVIACKIYMNDVLVRDFVATDSPQCGLYDNVSQQLFTNAGNGSFVYGTFYDKIYTPLQYIETTGNSYFLSPVIGTRDLSGYIAFMSSGSAATLRTVFGSNCNDGNCEVFVGDVEEPNANLYSSIENQQIRFTNSAQSSGYMDDKRITVRKATGLFQAYTGNGGFGTSNSHSGSSGFTTNARIAVGARYNSDGTFDRPFIGRIYAVGFGDQANYIPVLMGGVAGMYDTYNDVFKPSETNTPFIAGPSV